MDKARTIFERHIAALRKQCDAAGADNFAWTLLHLVEKKRGRENPQMPLALALNPKGLEKELLERYSADYFERLADVGLTAALEEASKVAAFETREKARATEASARGKRAAEASHAHDREMEAKAVQLFRSGQFGQKVQPAAEKISPLVNKSFRTVAKWLYASKKLLPA